MNTAQHTLALLGNLWAKNYANNKPFQTAVEANLDLLAQAQVDMQEAIDCVDRHSCPIYHTELWMPIHLKMSDINEGPYRSDYPLPSALRELPLLTNRLTSPSLVWHSGIDYQVRLGKGDVPYIIFEKDPFEEDLIPKVDDELTLWAYSAKLERNYLADHFGHLLGCEKPSSQAYKDFLNALFDRMVSGSGTFETFETFLNAMAGVPLAQRDGEVVEGLYFDARGPFVATDVQIYRVGDRASNRVLRGQRLKRGQPVYKEVELLVDSVSSPLCVIVRASKELFDENLLRQALPPELTIRFA